MQVSGLKFAFDPTKPSGERINPRLIKVQDEYLELEKEYAVATKYYLKLGKDGFQCFVDCPVLIEEENIPVLYNLVENHFKTVAKLKQNRTLQKFRSSLVPLVVVNRLINNLSEDPNILPEDLKSTESPAVNHQKLNFANAAYLISRVLSHKQKILSRKQRMHIKQSEKYKEKMNEYEERSLMLAPQVENRIICIRDQQVFF